MVTEHAEMRLLTRGITQAMLTEVIESPDTTILNSRGREEFIKGKIKVVIDDDPENYYDGLIITAHLIE